MLIPIRGIGTTGFIYDESAFDLPPSGVDQGKHLRVRDGRLQSGGGYLTYKDTTGGAKPTYSCPLLRSSGSGQIIFYDDLSVELDSGGVITALTPVVPFTSATGWQTCQVGDHLVITNGADVPHSYGPGQSKFEPLVGWPSDHRCEVIRSALGYLIAGPITEAGALKPGRIRWSDLIDPNDGTLVTDWDETLTTNRAGVIDSADGQGDIVDFLPFTSGVMIYLRYGVATMRYVGGNRVWDFRPLFTDGEGIIARNAVADIGTGHLMVTANGIFLNDGATKTPLSRGRVRRYTQEQFKSPGSVFCFANRREKEVWICYGTVEGNDFADRAIVWNYDYDVWTPLDLPTNAGVPCVSWISEGPEEFDITSWDDLTALGRSWDDLSSLGVTWDSLSGEPDELVPYVVAPNLFKVFRGDIGNGTVDGVLIESNLQQSSLDMDEAFKGSAPIKLLSEIYPLMRGTGTVKVRVGSSMSAGGSIAWGAEQDFQIGVERLVPVRASGQFFALSVRQTTGGNFELSGWDLSMEANSAR